VQLALTLPVGSATAEMKPFSNAPNTELAAIHHVGQVRFSSLALFNIESDLTGDFVPEFENMQQLEIVVYC